MCKTIRDVKTHLANPEFEIDEPLIGTYGAEVEEPKFGHNGVRYYPVHLWDYTGTIKAYAPEAGWPDIVDGAASKLHCGILLKPDRWGSSQAVIHPLPDLGPERSPMELLPAHVAPEIENLERLVDLFECLKTPAYRRFLEQVFRDDVFTRTFVTAPASGYCHHVETGGLLAHSLEVAEAVKAAVRGIEGIPSMFKEAAIITGLLHDAGKASLMGPDAKHYPRLRHQHEDLLEFALCGPLDSLKADNLDAASALWGTIKAYLTGNTYNMPLASLIRGADGASAQGSAIRIHGHAIKGAYWSKLGGRRPVWIPPQSVEPGILQR
ncbi:metal-dependent phosphohydrolase [Thioalkalivibrio versutus]|uniref:Metal-dependent phosphohydrolase n=1 Tax=Thioalkalivibrio versutus TaxID=106634 RepID=A0A0G3G171_9GAMM|nr:metal-dependent phosphohydrolase [Thioalkalivibrio versutus]AKJ94965.1 metal-dependent phosphohydrolase [Thioalkalivibrio versutus]